MSNSTKINEDNWTGFHFGGMTNGINEAPVHYDANVPNGVSILHGTGAHGGYVTPGGGNASASFTLNLFSNNTKSTVISKTAGGGAANGLAWFGTHFKEIAIVAAASAALVGLIKLIKKANREIKVRYNKVVKTLQRAQQDFTLKPEGLDSKAVMPGQGSKIADVFARLFTLNMFDKKRREATRTTNIGLYPFCDRYKEEITKDFKCAIEAFNKIKVASEEEKEKGIILDWNESAGDVKVYSSFHDAFFTDPILEGKNVNESALAAISAGIGLANLAVRGGQFVMSKLSSEGRPEEDSEKVVQVTKESIREICYSIIYQYLDKYINMDRVFKDMGISSESLADLDASSCDKLKNMLEKYQKPEKNQYSKQYFRIKAAYDNMLKHYYNIGDGIIKNFEKYTEAKDEKHANLLAAAKEKLQNMWDSQKDMFNSNFSHVLIEIVSSDVYIAYLNFILERVMPVFKTGLAGDTDYVLDIMPQKNQFYLVRQTQEQPWLEDDEANNGNVAIAKVESFDRSKQEIKVKIVGLLIGTQSENEEDYEVREGGIVTLANDAIIDYNAYKDDDGKKKEVTLKYGKWLSLDPLLMDWTENVESNMYMRAFPSMGEPEKHEYMYAYGSKENNDESGREEYNRIIFASYDYKLNEYTKVVLIKLKKPITNDEFRQLCQRQSEDTAKNMSFSDIGNGSESSWLAGLINRINSLEKEEVEVNSTEDIVKIVNEISESMKIKAATSLYKRTTKDKRGRDIDEYIFAEVSGDLESVYTESGAQRLNDRVNEAEDTSTNVIKPGDNGSDKNLIARMFCANVAAGKPLTGDRKENQFSGSIIKIDPACSVDDLNKEMQKFDPKFEIVENDADTLRKDIIDSILENKGSREVTLSGTYEVSKIGDAVAAIENRENSAEQMDNEIGNITSGIVEAMRQLNLNPETDFGKRKLKDRKNVFVGSKEYIFKGVTKDIPQMNKNGYFTVDTKITNNDGKNIEIDVFPVVMTTKSGNSPAAQTSQSLGAILMIDSFKQTVMFNEEDIKKGLVTLFNEYKSGHNMEDSRFSAAVATEQTADASVNTPDTSTNTNNASTNTANVTNGTDASTNNEGNNPTAKADGNGNVTDSVHVKYDSAKSIKEGLHTEVTVGRSYSEYMPKWYVVSESVYDDGCGKSTMLDSPAIRRKMNTRSDVMNFVKLHDNARIMQFESKHTYSISNNKGYVPSVATPLYESVMFVKFDGDDNVIEKIYTGNARVQ